MTTPTILRSITVDEEKAAILRVAMAALLDRPDVLSPEGRALARDLTATVQATFDDILAAKHRYEVQQATPRGEAVSDPATTTTIRTRAQIGDVWTYRTRAFAVLPDTRAREEAEAVLMARAQARQDVSEDLATIDVLSVKRTPTGRYSAIVKRTRIALTEGDL